MKLEKCPHYKTSEAGPRSDKCEDCGETFNLRACTTCGHVGCCESHLAHNTKHANATGHPVIRAVTRDGDGFLWCYQCNDYLR